MAPEPAASHAPAPDPVSTTVPPPTGPASVTTAPLDLNRATIEELDRLPGIGPVLARRIVEHRERNGAFRSVEELLGVPGIGVRSLERLRPLVQVRPR
jgi:competence protein ComEA